MHNLSILPSEDSCDPPYDEAALLAASRDDPEAFGLIYQHYVDKVYAYVLARSVNREEAAEVTQQIFLQAFDALPGYSRRPSPFAAWLFRIARNATIDAWRRRQGTITWDAVPEHLLPIAEHTPESEALRQEAIARVRGLLDSLDEDTRDLLLLRFAARLSSREIAEVIGKSEAATKKRLFRAIHHLKEQYDEQ